ncbi:hypothetical protein OPT61_g8376 [Boeremia exigua]|uniref:Uncharacterized protein n=1 Tax=Boeremia exigua TaxID=749465 RepID=A0ACC2HYE9_9PLEO|nr:hypothetical protein OPT61_g8376 [Boeremia exigua]
MLNLASYGFGVESLWRGRWQSRLLLIVRSQEEVATVGAAVVAFTYTPSTLGFSLPLTMNVYVRQSEAFADPASRPAGARLKLIPTVTSTINDKLNAKNVLNLVLSATTCGYILTAYYGYHFYDIPQYSLDLVVAMKWNYANSVIYNPILALIKASFLLILIKLRSPNEWINRCLWTTLVLNGCFAIAAPLACIFQCKPVSRYWNRNIAGTCMDPAAYIVSTCSIVLATDVLILLVPTWILHDITMPFGRKLMVIAFLSFTAAVTIVGAIRTSVLVRVFVLGQTSSDPTYSVNYTLSNI